MSNSIYTDTASSIIIDTNDVRIAVQSQFHSVTWDFALSTTTQICQTDHQRRPVNKIIMKDCFGDVVPTGYAWPLAS